MKNVNNLSLNDCEIKSGRWLWEHFPEYAEANQISNSEYALYYVI